MALLKALCLSFFGFFPGPLGISNSYCRGVEALCILFKALCLFALPNSPGPIFNTCPASIPVSRAVQNYADELTQKRDCERQLPNGTLINLT